MSIRCAFLAIVAVLLMCCGQPAAHADVVVGKPILGHQYPGSSGAYDYAPTVVQVGDIQHYYWCGYGSMMSADGTATANIYYATHDLSSNAWSTPTAVFGPSTTAGVWDNGATCDPTVVMGAFPYAGQTYRIAVYYTGTNVTQSGGESSIGVAFTNDWTTFVKDPNPVLAPGCPTGGISAPSAFNADGKSSVRLFYTDDETACGAADQETIAAATDGMKFTDARPITTTGFLGNSVPSYANFAYDWKNAVWYVAAAFAPLTTRSYEPNGSYSFGLYRIPSASLTGGPTPWKLLNTFDTNLTGYEINFSPAITRDDYGNVNVQGVFPNVQVTFAVGNPRTVVNSDVPTDIGYTNPQLWDITQAVWRTARNLVNLTSYHSAALRRTEVSTGWVDPTVFTPETGARQPGALYTSSTGDATRPLYGCRTLSGYDYFVSAASDCQGQKVLGVEGYAFGQAGTNRIPLYLCYTGVFHFVGVAADCRGYTDQGLLGYAHARV